MARLQVPKTCPYETYRTHECSCGNCHEVYGLCGKPVKWAELQVPPNGQDEWEEGPVAALLFSCRNHEHSAYYENGWDKDDPWLIHVKDVRVRGGFYQRRWKDGTWHDVYEATPEMEAHWAEQAQVTCRTMPPALSA